jgi:hypothetical protein
VQLSEEKISTQAAAEHGIERNHLLRDPICHGFV